MFKNLLRSDSPDAISSANKIQVILSAIKEVVKTIQANEYDSAKKNEQIKDGIDRKIHEEVLRLSEINENFKIQKKKL